MHHRCGETGASHYHHDDVDDEEGGGPEHHAGDDHDSVLGRDITNWKGARCGESLFF